ncbi:hypothetical protein H8D64_02530 [PVC group bacterium]|nr:hypothetical protein [PVC group bacterium]
MKNITRLVSSVAVMAICAVQVIAGGVKFTNEAGDYVKLGGRIQLQYHMQDPDKGNTTDELRFRRFRPYIEGSINEDWKGKFQFDLGKSDLALKDAYFKYSGLDGISISLGNMNFPFSREFLTSSKKQQLVERTFVGDHNYGTPDRQTGIHLNGKLLDKKVVLNASAGKAAIDPSNKKLDFDTVIQFDKGDDWIEGNIIGGRVELFPNGYFKPSQGDFKRDLKTAVALGAFSWQNDDDHVNMTEDEDTGVKSISDSDVDSVTGVEISAALRIAGFSLDAQYNMFDSDLINGASGTDGLYKNGKTTLENYAVEGGYMVIPSKLEIVAGYQSQDADGYATAWNRTSIGANIFVDKHNIKYQAAYRMGENKDGVKDNDLNELFVQAQYVF